MKLKKLKLKLKNFCNLYDKLAALAGGELLRTEGGYFGQIRNVKKPSTRLRETLINHKLALPLCLLMSTHRAHIVFKEGIDVHLKLGCSLILGGTLGMNREDGISKRPSILIKVKPTFGTSEFFLKVSTEHFTSF